MSATPPQRLGGGGGRQVHPGVRLQEPDHPGPGPRHRGRPHPIHRAARQLGLTDVPCVIAEDLTPEQVKAFRIADNKTGEIAEWNYELLPVELRELQDAQFDLSLLVSRGSSGKVCAICSDTATAQTLWIEIAWGGKTAPHRSRPRPCGHRTPSTTTQPPGQKCQ